MNINEADRVKSALQGVGASKIIYSLVMPETEQIKTRVLAGDLKGEFERTVQAGGSLTDSDALVKAAERARTPYYEKFREAWTQKQDEMDKEFFDTWLKWSSPISPVNEKEFCYKYPTSGASEGLRCMVDEYGARARRDSFQPEIHLFNGEYEGFGAYADAAYIPVKKHDRGNWKQAIEEIAKASKDKPVQIYLSQPSAIDGNVWKDYDAFMQELAKKAPNAEVMLDLTYVGCISKEAKIRTDYPNIPAIVFSLSKPVGGYYDRIGGVLAKPRAGDNPEAYPALFGNKWFKNLTALAIGTEFMKTYGVYELPKKYAPLQEKAIEQIRENLRKQGHDLDLHPSDVFLLATGEMPTNRSDIHTYLERPGDGKSIIRMCLTPTMGEMLGMAKTHEVNPRYYERM